MGIVFQIKTRLHLERRTDLERNCVINLKDVVVVFIVIFIVVAKLRKVMVVVEVVVVEA